MKNDNTTFDIEFTGFTKYNKDLAKFDVHDANFVKNLIFRKHKK